MGNMAEIEDEVMVTNNRDGNIMKLIERMVEWSAKFKYKFENMPHLVSSMDKSITDNGTICGLCKNGDVSLKGLETSNKTDTWKHATDCGSWKYTRNEAIEPADAANYNCNSEERLNDTHLEFVSKHEEEQQRSINSDKINDSENILRKGSCLVIVRDSRTSNMRTCSTNPCPPDTTCNGYTRTSIKENAENEHSCLHSVCTHMDAEHLQKTETKCSCRKRETKTCGGLRNSNSGDISNDNENDKTTRRQLWNYGKYSMYPRRHGSRGNKYTLSTGSGKATGRRWATSDIWTVILVALICCTGVNGLTNNNILQLNIPTEEPVVDSNTICKTYPELSSKQYRLCAKYPDVVASAIQGIQVAIHECQHQMKEQRWNCSSLEKKNKNPHSSPMLKKGYRESAFAYALASAGVTHQVSKACSMGKLKSCGCDMSMQGEVRDDFEWGGCSHNVEFGDRFSKRFTLARERARDIHGRINHHNNRAGRLVIMKNVRKQCKCHGMSGSCEIKTCWKVSPDFRVVGDILKKKFEKANKVNISNKTDKKSRRRLMKKQKKSDLVYFEKSPNFCDANKKVDSPGTTGRYCNKNIKGAGNCDTLCCGRGYNTMKIKRTERCNCKFHWCCYVVCETCTYNEWVTVCK